MFLLLVFSLNTVVSFACSLGGFFHTFHHASASAAEEPDGHHPQKEEHHDHSTSHHNSQPPEKEDDDCCSKNVVAVEKAEKAISRTIQAPDAIFLTSFFTVYSSLFSSLPAEESTAYPSIVRWRLPATIQDLRIVIQSFQI